MEERQLFNNRLQQELQSFQQTGFSTSLNTRLFALVNQRFSGSPLRAYFVYQMAGYLHQNQKRRKRIAAEPAIFDTKLPFIFEMVITIQYLHNQVLDQKAGVTTPQQINNNLLNANLLKDLLYQYISQSFDRKTEALVQHYVRQAFMIVDIGQRLEKDWNTLSHFDASVSIPTDILPPDLEQFIELDRVQPFLRHLEREVPKNKWDYTALYLKRIYLTCGALFVLATKLLIELRGASTQTAEQAIQFSVCYGMMRQLINDNADLVPSQLGLTTRAKKASDAFSDIKNGSITLPVLLHLTQQEAPLLREVLQKGHDQWDAALEPPIHQALLESHALFKSIQFGKVLAAMCTQALAGQGESRQALLKTCEIAYWNKFLYPAIKTSTYRAFRKTSFYRHTKRLIRQLQNPAIPQTKEIAGLDPLTVFGRKMGRFLVRLCRKRVI
jgi:geranylgeranyl pyrophosphate synthase